MNVSKTLSYYLTRGKMMCMFVCYIVKVNK